MSDIAITSLTGLSPFKCDVLSAINLVSTVTQRLHPDLKACEDSSPKGEDVRPAPEYDKFLIVNNMVLHSFPNHVRISVSIICRHSCV